MNRAIGFSMVFLACLPLSAGCSSERSASSLLETTTARAQADTMVYNVQTELAALRRDLAAARITTPKQEGGAAEVAPGPVARDKPTPPRIVPSAVFLAPAEPAPRSDHASDRSPQQRLIRVHPGDSLWKLAHEHASTIDVLKRVNGLTTDVVHAGQRLILLSQMSINISH